MWILSYQIVGDIPMSRVGGHLSWNARKWHSRKKKGHSKGDCKRAHRDVGIK